MATTETSLRISPADHGRKMTLHEFWDAEEVGDYRYELARGVLEVTHVPGEQHAFVVCFFYGAFERYRQAHPGVIHRFGGASEFRLWLPSMISGRNPDAAVVVRHTAKDPRGYRPPALAIEVVSEGSEARERDYQTKREEYLAFGLREYWIVDPIERRVTVLLRDGDAWVERQFGEGQVAEGLVLPGFTVALADIWNAMEQADDHVEE
jgi:Uma2 family endonuclease